MMMMKISALTVTMVATTLQVTNASDNYYECYKVNANGELIKDPNSFLCPLKTGNTPDKTFAIDCSSFSFSSKKITKMAANVFEGIQPEELTLHGCANVDIASNFLAPLTGLKKLSINNGINKQMDSDLLQQNKKLQDVELVGVNLNGVNSKDLLRNNKALTKISFTTCGMKTISPNTFDVHPKLKDLFLDNNGIETLPNNLLKNNVNLQRVGFANNNLTSIRSDFFQANTKLKSVTFDGNSLLRALPKNLFARQKEVLIVNIFQLPNLKKLSQNYRQYNPFIGVNNPKASTLDFVADLNKNSTFDCSNQCADCLKDGDVNPTTGFFYCPGDVIPADPNNNSTGTNGNNGNRLNIPL
eukprot:Pgem_evm1s3600